MRNWADRENAFAPATVKGPDSQLEHVNLMKGLNWHSAE
jgi:hypothetical protein